MEEKPLGDGLHHHHHHEHPTGKSKSVFDHLKVKMRRKHTHTNDSSNLHHDAANQTVDVKSSNENLLHDESSQLSNSETSNSIHFHRSASSLTSLNESKEVENNSNENHHREPNENKTIGEKNEISSIENIQIDAHNNSSGLHARSEPHSIHKKHYEIPLKSMKAANSIFDIHYQSKSKKGQQKYQTTSFQNNDASFHIIFNDLPRSEQLIIAYPCAWRKDVFMHGRIFLSSNYLSFYACFIKWEESRRISYKDIMSVTRDKSTLIIPNAIKIRTKNDEEYLFATYAPREKVFVAIFRIWQNALLGRPLNDQQLRTAIYADQRSFSESSGESEEMINIEDSNEVGHKHEDTPKHLNVTLNSQHKSFSSSSISTSSSLKPVQSSDHSISLKPVEERIVYPLKCTCETHLAKTYIDRIFNVDVDTLYDLIFGDNQSTRDFFDSQKFLDYTFGEWTTNVETGKRERAVTYRTVNQSLLGSNLIQCREKHIVEEEKPSKLYVLTTEAYSEGMKYADTFYILTRYCLVQRDAEHTSLRISAEPRFIKYVIGFVKTIMEKSIITSIESELNERVQKFIIKPTKEINCEVLKKEISQSETYSQEAIDIVPIREEIQETAPIEPILQPTIEKPVPEKIILYENRRSNSTIIFGILFLLIHAFLWYKLFSIERNIVVPENLCSDYCKTAWKQNMYTD